MTAAAATRTPEPARPPTRDTLLTQLRDHIHELTEPHTTTHRWRTWSPSRNPIWHQRTITIPPLLDQLRAAAHDRTTGRAPRISNRGATPSPPINVAAIDAWTSIARHVHTWITALGARPADVHTDLRALAITAVILDDDTLTQLTADVRTWHHTAHRITHT